MIGLMDDQTMFDLFDSFKRDFESLKRELIQELQPVKEGLARIEAELDRQISELEGQFPA